MRAQGKSITSTGWNLQFSGPCGTATFSRRDGPQITTHHTEGASFRMSKQSGALHPAPTGRSGFLSADAARLVSDADTRSGAELHIATFGLNGDDDALVRAIVGVLQGRTRAPWAVSNVGDSDVVIVSQNALPLGRNRLLEGRLIVVLRSETETSALGDYLGLPAPISVMNVMDVLNLAAERLARTVAPMLAETKRVAKVAPIAPKTSADGSSLASTIGRLVSESHYKRLRVRVADFGVLWLSFADQRYQIDFPKERLVAALRARRYVLTAVSEKGLTDGLSVSAEGPLSELLWIVGLSPCVEFAVADDAHLRLNQWPNFPKLPHAVEHLQLCGLMNGRATTFNELVAESGVSRDAVKTFVTAAVLCGSVHAGSQAPTLAENAAPARSMIRGGFFERLRQRLGF
jgi:hypothetical protein